MLRAICVFALALAPVLSLAQEEPAGTISFNHVALSVEDVDRSAAFYRDIFGLTEITNRTEIPGIRWFSFDEGKELHLISVGNPPGPMPKELHFALTTTNFDGLIDVLRSSGVEFSDFPGNVGQVSIRADQTRQIYLRDPDGYWIEVNSVATDEDTPGED